MEKYIHDVKTIVESMGKKIVNIEWYDNIYTWLNWYKGKVDNFHNYKIYNGQEYVEKTRYWVHKMALEAFSWEDDGFPGDEDNGTTAAWYVFVCLGLYPLCPGKNELLEVPGLAKEWKINA